MGYLIENTSNFPVQIAKVFIDSADVSTLATTPIEIIPAGTGINYLILSAVIQVGKQTIQYTGFSHIYLTDNATLKYALIETASFGGVIVEGTYSFALNMTHPPNRFGIRISSNKPINIATNTNPTAGNGDWTVTLYYIELKDL